MILSDVVFPGYVFPPVGFRGSVFPVVVFRGSVFPVVVFRDAGPGVVRDAGFGRRDFRFVGVDVPDFHEDVFVVRLEDVAAGDDADEFFRVRFHDDGDVADVTGDEAVEDDVERFVRVGDDEVFRHDVFDQDRFRVDADEFVARVAERDDTGERDKHRI